MGAFGERFTRINWTCLHRGFGIFYWQMIGCYVLHSKPSTLSCVIFMQTFQQTELLQSQQIFCVFCVKSPDSHRSQERAKYQSPMQRVNCFSSWEDILCRQFVHWQATVFMWTRYSLHATCLTLFSIFIIVLLMSALLKNCVGEDCL